ncbi:signal recognition particle-docking protein FtsY [Providencia rettgeri]|uniref:Signal recognition particle receptor FtsY n=1 Tax=Providencia rettgeri TaxID=587 RepID=A0AB35LAM0_PRORE|nr:signal recognition particle-docking protein FtsY [Providencia rettgeri]MBQ0606539.1 signal recognition particle-docking protein FtsY [Providencia rettgeri]MCB4814094.1 signal recognition particle-docking protein FtsY [Providencia rettgeri]MCJ2287408.1 signal recognition particle-docking protein FtsY [Providencia rettgeri]MDE4733160.1 signal recognition particle-docking protein FtsY [Providencia rettgeri]MDH2305981.1 signal recognition particle-docking protein FtsY [Providencia rettgeri]
MAKDKKKGFFSWLGFGRKNEEETQQQEQQQTQQNDVVNDVENQSTHEAAVDAATAEAERQHQAEQAAIKAAEDEAQRQYEAQQAAIDAATEQAEREREAKLAELQAAEEQAEQARQEAEEKKLAEEKAERERQEAEAMRLAEEEMARQRQVELTAIQAAEEAEEQRRQAELAAIQAAEEQAERERQTAEAARLAEEQAERERQAAEAARLAEEQAERERQAAEAARLAEEQAERERQAAEAARLAEEQAERERQAAEAARLAEEQAERERQAAEAARLAEEQAERERQAAEAARLAEEQAERERQAAEAARLAEEQAAEDARIAEEEAEAERLRLEEEKNNLPTEQEKPKKEGFFARLKKGLLKTRQNLGSGFFGLFSGKKIDDDLFEELEEQLLIADVGVDTTRKIIDNLTAHASRKELKDAEVLYGKLREEMSDILAKVDKPLVIEDKKPYVILMVGVNGVGKTTTIGKLARQYQSEGKSVMLAAGDTFRAAAVEQLQVWGERNKIPVVAQHTGADPASVIFDAIQSAQAKGVDVLIADTAGRLQNKSHLMEELKKIVRVMKKLDENAPHEIMLTLDASTGQNAVSQAKLFDDAVGLTGITLTKLDGTAKGGVIFSIADQFGIPIRYIGIGEGIEDLRPFKADDFIEALFAREE